jgi:EamA domain-containing membrane protein RarD
MLIEMHVRFNEQHREGNKPSVFQCAHAIISNTVLIFYHDDRSRKYLRNIGILYYTVPIISLVTAVEMHVRFNEQHREDNKPAFQCAHAIISNTVLIFYHDDRSRKYLRNIGILSYYTVPIISLVTAVRASDRTQAHPVSAL